MGRYYYSNATDALDAKKQFLREHHYKISHCFKNTWGTGYVLFDTKEEVNQWHKEHTGSYFYKEEYEPGTNFTETDAMKEIEAAYGTAIDNVLNNRTDTCPLLAIGLPSKTAFGNRMLLKFVRSTDEEDIESRFYIHYSPQFINIEPSYSNSYIKQSIIKILYNYFYDSRFKARIDGSKEYHHQKQKNNNTNSQSNFDFPNRPYIGVKELLDRRKQEPTYTPPKETLSSTHQTTNRPKELDRGTIEAGCGIVAFIGLGCAMVGGFIWGGVGGIIGFIGGTILAIYIVTNMD